MSITESNISFFNVLISYFNFTGEHNILPLLSGSNAIAFVLSEYVQHTNIQMIIISETF